MALTSLYERWICASTSPGSRCARPDRGSRPRREMGASPAASGPAWTMVAPSIRSAAPSRAGAPVPSISRRFRRSRLIARGVRDHRAHPVHGGGGGDVEALQIGVAPREVGGVLGDLDHAEIHRLRAEHVDAAGPAAVHVAGGVDLHPVRRALALAAGLRPHLPPARLPSGRTSKTRICWRAVSLTKRRRLSREKQSPFGRSKSSTSSAGRRDRARPCTRPGRTSSCGRSRHRTRRGRTAGR